MHTPTIHGEWPRVLLDARRSLRIALPLMGAQILQMLNGFVDTVVSGQLGSVSLAAVGIGASIWFFHSIFCIGMVTGLSPILSQQIGARRSATVGRWYRQGLWVGIVAGLLMFASLRWLITMLPATAIDPEIVPEAQAWLRAASWGVLPVGLLVASRNVFEASGVTRPVLMVQALGLLLNLVLDIGIGLGAFGLPRMGVVGLGWATTAVHWLMVFELWRRLHSPRFRRFELFGQIERPDWAHIHHILRLSIPIWLSIAFETGLFVATALQMSMLGTLPAAAHMVAINIASLMFMLPLGLSFALAARIGRVNQPGQGASVRLRISAGILIALTLGLVTALLLVVFRHALAGVYTDERAVIELASSLMLLAAVFQLSDSLQVALFGMLRGLQDTLVPMLLNAFAYWGVAFGVGWYAAHRLNMGAHGFWIGLITGLSLAAVLLGLRLRFVLRRQHSR